MTQPSPTRPVAAIAALSSYYFFNFGALGAFFPFLPLILDDRGLDARQISWVLALAPLANLVVPPLWGMAADFWRARVALLRIACAGCAVSVLLLFPSWGLVGALVGMGLVSFFRAPMIPLADATAYSLLRSPDTQFARVRVFGSIGFACFTLAIGWLGGSTRPGLTLTVVGAAFLAAGLSTLPLRSSREGRERGVLRQVGHAVSSRAVRLFLAGNVFYYLGHATYDAFFGLYARSLGMSDRFVGTAWSAGVSVEIGVMLLAPRLLPRIPSGRLLSLCALVAAVRWAATAHLTSPGPLLAAQLLHGVTFGLWYLSLVKHTQALAPPRLRASLQSVAIACMGGGMVFGFIGGGALFEAAGGAALYRLAAISALAAWLLYRLALRSERSDSAYGRGEASRH